MIFVDENAENQSQHNNVWGNNNKGNQTIKNALRELSFKTEVDIDQLQPSLLNVLEALVMDREHWRREALTHSQESSRVHASNILLEKEKDHLASTIENLKRDLLVANSRTSALINEQRDLRNHWLADKADLQSRFCQVQGLNTQIQGTLKKKEKEFEKLQAQLTKLVKDSARGVKSTIMISAPLKKATSQEISGGNHGGLLRDAEVLALKRSLQQFQQENSTIEKNLQEIKSNLAELQSNFESKLQEIEGKHRIQVDTILAEKEADAAQKRISQQINLPLKTEEIIFESKPINPPQSPEYVMGTPDSHQVKSLIKSAVRKTPGTIAKKYLEGTPGVRPLNWIIQQTNTEIKNLRYRVDDIVNGSHESSTAFDLDNSTLPAREDALAKIVNLRARLAEALVVIQEQDRLIHEGKSFI